MADGAKLGVIWHQQVLTFSEIYSDFFFRTRFITRSEKAEKMDFLLLVISLVREKIGSGTNVCVCVCVCV